ncbi:hypothetical protein CASFOL_008619 [Castilleja foliolosa]|uniref:Uncharacterized protein n=1 Tax=Castilleja foliolosa TaxID=1961234 RepID=A0ABD3E3J7_9LAMI
MLNDTTEFMQHHRLQFADSLKDLKKQLYSAAERFESSYDENDHKQFVVQLSKDYVAKALVSTVDHLGSVADKLNKFLDEQPNQLSATNISFFCIEQRLSTFHEFIDTKGTLQPLLMTGHRKHYVLPPYNEQQHTPIQDFQASRKKPNPPLLRKQQPTIMMPSREQSPDPRSFSFTRPVPNKEAGKRSISPFRFPLNRSGSDSKRSDSPSPSVSKLRAASEGRRAISASRGQDMTKREKEVESYTSRSKQLFRALVSSHRSGK